MIDFFGRFFTQAGALALNGVHALFDLFGKLSGCILFPAIKGLGAALSLGGKITLNALDGLFHFDPLDFFVDLGDFGICAIGEFFAGIKAGALNLCTGFIDMDDILITLGSIDFPALVLGQIKQLINLFLKLPGLSLIADVVSLSLKFVVDAATGIQVPDIQVRFGANGEFGIQSLFDILKGSLSLDNFDPVAMIKASLPGAKQFLFEGIDTFLPAFEDFTINPLDLSFVGDFIADCDGLAFIKAKLTAGLEHAINFAINGINGIKVAGMATFHAAETAFHVAQKAFFAAQQLVWDLAAKKKKLIADITGAAEFALNTAKAAVDTALGAWNLKVEARNLLKIAFDAAKAEVAKIDKEIARLNAKLKTCGFFGRGPIAVAITAQTTLALAAKAALLAAETPFIAADLAVGVAKAALDLARKKYNELPSISDLLGNVKCGGAAKFEIDLNLAIKAYEAKKVELGAIQLELKGLNIDLGELQLSMNPFNIEFIKPQIERCQLAISLKVAAEAAAKIALGGLLRAVETARGALKAAVDAGAGLIGDVALAGVAVAEGAAKAALATAELALAAPKAAFDLALGVYNTLKAAVEVALKFGADALAGLANFALTGISGAISVTGAKQEMHLSARMNFLGIKFGIKVDIDFAEIGAFVDRLIHAVMETFYSFINGFGVSLSFEVHYSS